MDVDYVSECRLTRIVSRLKGQVTVFSGECRTIPKSLVNVVYLARVTQPSSDPPFFLAVPPAAL